MKKWFKQQSRLLQIILLLIPIVNWVVEICVRWEDWSKHKGLIKLIFALIATFGLGNFLGWLDLIWVLLTGNLFLVD